MDQLKQLTEIAQQYPDGKVLFEDRLQVKATPHQLVFTAFGVWAGPNGVYILDGAGEWHGPLQETQAHGPLMINSILQRLKAIEWKRNCKLTA